MAKPQIGVVVPTLNGAATLEWTFCALKAQRGIDVKVLVVDSGSEDGTLDICKHWGIETIYAPPGNMYHAINQGMLRMDTEWVTYLNSDDLVYPRSYSRLVSFGEANGASLVYGDCDYVDYEGRFLFSLHSPTPARIRGVLLYGGIMGFAQPASVFRRSAFHQLGGLDEQYRYIADYDFFFRMTFADYKLARLGPPSIASFRVHTSQLGIRVADKVSDELKSFRASRNIRVSRLGIYDMLRWRFQNLPAYLGRLLKHGHLRSHRLPILDAEKAG